MALGTNQAGAVAGGTRPGRDGDVVISPDGGGGNERLSAATTGSATDALSDADGVAAPAVAAGSVAATCGERGAEGESRHATHPSSSVSDGSLDGGALDGDEGRPHPRARTDRRRRPLPSAAAAAANSPGPAPLAAAASPGRS